MDAGAGPERVSVRPYGHSLIAGRHDVRRAFVTFKRETFQ